MSTRTEGLIWIDRNSPYRLKYHTRGEDYTVEVATNYDVTSDSTAKKISAGQVLTLKSENGKVIATHAKFPKDLDAVAGVALQSQLNGKVTIGNSGYIVLNADQINKSFVSGDKEEIIAAGATAYIGAPVYWFIGRFKKGTNGGSDGFDYSSSSANIGCITVGTPSGYKVGRDKVGTSTTSPREYISREFNVEYDNLPQIGSIVKYEIKDNSITSMTIQLNFSDFDSTIEWSWPYICEGSTGCGKVSQITTETVSDADTNFFNRRQLQIKHCLFPNGTDGVEFGATESVTAYYEHDGTVDEYHIETAMKHVTDDKGGYSEFNGSTPEDDLKYRITGSVTYKAHTNA